MKTPTLTDYLQAEIAAAYRADGEEAQAWADRVALVLARSLIAAYPVDEGP